MAFPALLNFSKISMEKFVRNPRSTIRQRPGMSPKTFMVAGNAMIPAPTIVVDRLNTAPENDALVYSDFSASCRFSGSRGTLSFFSSSIARAPEFILEIAHNIQLFAFNTNKIIAGISSNRHSIARLQLFMLFPTLLHPTKSFYKCCEIFLVHNFHPIPYVSCDQRVIQFLASNLNELQEF
eukprot:Gb_00074 [translate_table: standard]